MPDGIKQDYNGLVVVNSLASVFNVNYFDPANVIEYSRNISGDFDGLALKIQKYFGFSGDFSEDLSQGQIQSFLKKADLSNDESLAGQQVLKDLKNISVYVPDRNLRINGGDSYKDHDNGAAFGFHADGSARIICNYNEPTTNWLKIGDEEPDQDMLESYGYSEYFSARAGAQIQKMQVGHLYHFLGLMSDYETTPFVHKGVRSDQPRLLMTGEYYDELDNI